MNPRPPSRTTLELLSDRSMPGFERGELGGWVLRAAAGATGRANTAWPTNDPGRSIADAVDYVEAWYAARGLRPGFQVFDGTDDDVVAVLDERRYEHAPGALAMWAPIDHLEFGTASPTDRAGWLEQIDPAPPAEFAALIGDPGRVREISASSLKHLFATVYEGDRLLGGGKAAIDGCHVGIFAVLTDPAARRRGVASVVMQQLIARSIREGADSVWLQVMAENTAARQMYDRAGFVTLHRYEYRFAAESS